MKIQSNYKNPKIHGFFESGFMTFKKFIFLNFFEIGELATTNQLITKNKGYNY